MRRCPRGHPRTTDIHHAVRRFNVLFRATGHDQERRLEPAGMNKLLATIEETKDNDNH